MGKQAVMVCVHFPFTPPLPKPNREVFVAAEGMPHYEPSECHPRRLQEPREMQEMHLRSARCLQVDQSSAANPVETGSGWSKVTVTRIKLFNFQSLPL